MANVIVLGSSTSHGGKVVSGCGKVTVNGRPVARVGDMCTCPIRGHGMCSIIEGDAHDTIDGVPVAYDGHKTSCGAVLISSVNNCSKS